MGRDVCNMYECSELILSCGDEILGGRGTLCNKILDPFYSITLNARQRKWPKYKEA